jgi:hypothetical protein
MNVAVLFSSSADPQCFPARVGSSIERKKFWERMRKKHLM